MTPIILGISELIEPKTEVAVNAKPNRTSNLPLYVYAKSHLDCDDIERRVL